MSKERARARAVREEAREQERQRAAKARSRQAKLAALKPTLPSIPRRRRRYGSLPTKVLLGLAFGWLLTQWLVWQLFFDTRSRVGLALITLLALPLVVVLVQPRRTR